MDGSNLDGIVGQLCRLPRLFRDASASSILLAIHLLLIDAMPLLSVVIVLSVPAWVTTRLAHLLRPASNRLFAVDTGEMPLLSLGASLGLATVLLIGLVPAWVIQPFPLGDAIGYN